EGMKAGAKLDGGATGLHWAAYQGQAETVRLLLERGATVDAIDDIHDGTPLGWALYGWGGSREQRSYYEVVALLARAGAKPNARWFEANEDRMRAAEKIWPDPRMQAALRGET